MGEIYNQENIYSIYANSTFFSQKIQHNTTFEQKLIGSEYYLIGKIDGVELLNIINPQPKNYENMKLNGELGHRATGEIRNITLSGTLYSIS